MRLARWIVAGIASLAPLCATADRALVVGAPEPAAPGLFRGEGVPDVAAALRAAGFDVLSIPGQDAAEMRAALSALLETAAGEERLVIHLTGPFAYAGERSWLIARGAEPPDLATVSAAGLPVETVLQIAGLAPGGAVVALAVDDGGPASGSGLAAGLRLGTIPQGVTVLRGPVRPVAAFVAGPLLEAGAPLASRIAEADVMGLGFVTDRVPFLPAGAARPPGPPDPAEVERAIWEATQAQDSVDSYEGYLARYPEGRFAEDARAGIERIVAEPAREARLAEEALGLEREQRRQIQRHLTILEYEPRGIDGIFGPGTRAAIARFQVRTGFPETGYLTERQIERLALQAERRQAELEAEAERRRLAQEERDRAAWEATGSGADEAGLRTYLERYPDGLFSESARARLAEIEAEKRDRAAARDAAAWDDAAAAGTPQAYRSYLRAFPEGAFTAEARARIEALEAERGAPREAARQAEAALGLNPITRTLIERRLAQLELEPGTLDGTFDEATRRAIRRFQRARDLSATGFIDEATLVRMLADLRDILE